jgi:acyl-CoA hydrolase
METHRLVLPADLNQYGSLFGGRLLAWVVTVGMDRVEFRHGVRDGTILRIRCERVSEGKTSVTYQVEVSDAKPHPRPIFSTKITFVSVDDEGRKRPIHG